MICTRKHKLHYVDLYGNNKIEYVTHVREKQIKYMNMYTQIAMSICMKCNMLATFGPLLGLVLSPLSICVVPK